MISDTFAVLIKTSQIFSQLKNNIIQYIDTMNHFHCNKLQRNATLLVDYDYLKFFNSVMHWNF